MLDDCLPVAEEKFKDVLKENYYTRSKFEGLLKADQVPFSVLYKYTFKEMFINYELNFTGEEAV